LLKVSDLNVCYGAIWAIHDVSFHVDKGEIVTLIGANGAGKTTIMQTISGLLKPKSGEAVFMDTDLFSTEAHNIPKMGLVQVPERRRIFANLSVLDNLLLGAYTRKDKSEIEEDLELVFTKFKRLRERKKQLAGTLSGGEQQMLAMGRALMTRPKLLLLDEPSMGLSPILVNEIFKTIQEINEDGVTILLVEQNAKKALSIANRAYVLETGRIVMEGSAKELLENDEVKKAYLGSV